MTRSTLYRRVEALLDQRMLQRQLGGRGNYRRLLVPSPVGRERAETEAVEVLRPILLPRMSQAARQLTLEERLLRQMAIKARKMARCIAHLQADIAWLQRVISKRLGERPAAVAQKLAG